MQRYRLSLLKKKDCTAITIDYRAISKQLIVLLFCIILLSLLVCCASTLEVVIFSL